MITRIILTIGTLAVLIAKNVSAFHHMVGINPGGWNWYLANAIIQVGLWWGFCMWMVWWFFPVKKPTNL